MLSKLIEINNKLLTKYEQENNKDKVYRHKIIKALLTNKNCFFEMSIEDAYNILDDLGYKEEEMKGIYTSLVNSEEYKKYITGD